MALRLELVLGSAAAIGIVLACACGSDTSSSTQPQLTGGAAGNAGDASAGTGGKAGAATGGKAGAGGSAAGGAGTGGTGGTGPGGNAGTSPGGAGGSTTGGAGGTSTGGSGGLPANPTPQDWGVQMTGLGAPFTTITPMSPSACAALGQGAGTTDINFWTPDGPPRAWVDMQGATHLMSPHMLTYQFVGGSLDSVALNCSGYISKSDFDVDPAHNNDASWPWAPYRLPDGRLFVLYHHEYHGQSHGTCTATPEPWGENCWHPSLTFGIAQDASLPGNGAIVRPASPNNVIAQWNGSDPVGGGGFSDPTNIMLNPADGMYYMMALVRGLTKSDGYWDPVLRNCMLRTTDVTNPAQWTAWNGSAFVGPLNGGASCVDVTGQGQGNPSAPGSLVYSTYFNRVLYLTFGMRADGRQGFFVRAALNSELTQWSAPTIVLGVQVPWGPNTTPMRVGDAYPSFLDPSAGAENFDRIGQSPYLYWVRTFLGDQTKLRREIWRVPLQFYSGAPERDNRVQGFFSVSGGGHYSNGQGSYCDISSMFQLDLCGYKDAFTALPDFIDPGADVHQSPNPTCTCGPNPMGCYRVGPAGYFANGQGASCPLLGCQMQMICGTTDFNSLPARQNTGGDQVNGACTNPPGCYHDGPGGYYSNGAGHSCPFLFSQMQGLCGTSDFNALPPGCPGGDQVDGQCGS
ncbi:MAG: hypothetical protein HY898_30060 [Deltaproteobacteria bacterium]|nr:hypothetical protein [Deltaproteobacteria bacterium]